MGGGRRLETGVAVAVGGAERLDGKTYSNKSISANLEKSLLGERTAAPGLAPPPYCTAVSRLDHAAAPVEPRQPTLSNTHPRTRPFDT